MAKKTYAAPVAEKISFQYKEQVVASTTSCTQDWTGYGDSQTTGCSYTVAVRDSGY